MKLAKLNLRTWLPLVFVGTLIVGFVYGAVQQDIRLGANDPQIQLAEDAANDLNNGSTAADVVANASLSARTDTKVDISISLAPFLIVYGSDKQIVTAGAQLDGADPVVPDGVFNNVTSDHEARFTWQPRSGVRIATVVVKSNTGYVLAGRSMREIELREDHIVEGAVIVWIVMVAGSLFLVPLFAKW